jgi:hypothetical protein
LDDLLLSELCAPAADELDWGFACFVENVAQRLDRLPSAFRNFFRLGYRYKVRSNHVVLDSLAKAAVSG